MSNSIAPGSSADVNVRVTALTTNPNVPVTYKTIILKKNLVNGVNTLTQEMMSATNTKYVIKYDYVLGEGITIPANCILEFDGGSINGNGANKNTITGNNTQIVADEVEIFNAVIFDGSWNIPYITSNWITDIHSANVVRQLINLTNEDVENTVVLHPGNYPLAFSHNLEYGLILNSNTRLIINGDIVLQANGYKNYAIIWAQSQFDSTLFPDGVWNGTVLTSEDEIYDWVEAGIITKITRNITIEGSGHIIGDRPNHTSDEGEWGHGIELYYTHDVEIKGVNISDTWGDGIYVTGVVNCSVHDVEIDHANRNGITVTSCNNMTIENSLFTNMLHKAPQAGICAEPNYKYELCNDLFILNNKFLNCGGGIALVPARAFFYNNQVMNNEIIWDTDGDSNIASIRVEGNNFSTHWCENINISYNRIVGYQKVLNVKYVKDLVFSNNVHEYSGTSTVNLIDHCERLILRNNRFELAMIKIQICNYISVTNNLIDGYTGMSISYPQSLFLYYCDYANVEYNNIVGGVYIQYVNKFVFNRNYTDQLNDSTNPAAITILSCSGGDVIGNECHRSINDSYRRIMEVNSSDNINVLGNKFVLPDNVSTSVVVATLGDNTHNCQIFNNWTSPNTLTNPFLAGGTNNITGIAVKNGVSGTETASASIPSGGSYTITEFTIPADKLAFVQLNFPDAHGGVSNFFCSGGSAVRCSQTHAVGNLCTATVSDGNMTITASSSYGLGTRIGYKVTYIG